jgi:hypothetical protein
MEESEQRPAAGADRLVQEETEKIIHHINAALPKELAESLSQSGELKEKLLGYFERNIHAIAGAYAPKGIAELLEQAGGADRFTTREVERSLVNMYGHLQGHIQRGINELENQTNSLLRQNTGSGAFIRGDKAYTVVKSSFRDNPERPGTVTDLKLCINIPESELITPIFHYQVTTAYLIKDILSKNITDTIDREIAKLRDERLDEGLEELTDAEILISKLEILDRLKESGAEPDPAEYDRLNTEAILKKVVDSEYIRDRGFNIAVNSLITILDNSRLSFQFIENFKSARELRIREYDDRPPDEHYQIRMRYCDNAQLREECSAYDVRMQNFETEILRIQGKTGEPDMPPPGKTDVEKMNPTYACEQERIKARIKMMREMIQDNSELRSLEKEYTRFDSQSNPYHLHPGLVLDVDVTSIKRKRITLNAMSKALNEFLQSVSRGFQETSFREDSFPSPAAPDGQSFGDLLSGVSGDGDSGIREL